MRELIVFLFLLSVFSALAGAYFSRMARMSSQEAKRKSYAALKSQANAMTFIFLSGLILSQSLILASNFTAPDVPTSAPAGTPAGLVVSEPSSGGQAAPGNTNSTQAAPPATVIAPQEPPPAPPSGAGNSSGAQEKSPPENPAAPEAPPAPVNASEPAHGVAAPNDTAHTAPPAEPVKSCAPACEPCIQSVPASCTGIRTCTNETCSTYPESCSIPPGTGCGKNTVNCPSGGCVGSDYYAYPANDSCTKSCEGSGNCQSCTPSCAPAISPNDTRCASAHPAAGNSTAVNLTPNMTPPEISVPKAAPVHEPSPAVLGISLNISGNVRRGDAFSLFVEITNAGASGAKNVALDFIMPEGVSFASGEKSIGEIPAGEKIRREFIFQSSYSANLGAGKIKVRMTYE